jgi:hypothetical protein
MQAHLLLPLRKLPSEVRQDILRLINREINEIGQLTKPLAYWVIDEVKNDDLEVFCKGQSPEGGVYSVVKIIDPRMLK